MNDASRMHELLRSATPPANVNRNHGSTAPRVVVQRGGVYIHTVAAGGTVVIHTGDSADPDEGGEPECAKSVALHLRGAFGCAKRAFAALARSIAPNVREYLAKSGNIREFLTPLAVLKEPCVSYAGICDATGPPRRHWIRRHRDGSQ